jgi:hypothetical protein
MKQSGLPTRLRLGTLALGLLAGCSGGGGDGGGRMFVLSCSLGCNNGAGGQDVTCGIVNTFVNQDIAIQFSEEVDLAWVQANTTAFQVIDDSTAASPPGEYLLDPADRKTLIFRPQLDFSPAGAPVFGFEDDAVYRILVPGTISGAAGPFVQSVDGKQNESRVQCTITTSEGITDPIPGPPDVQVFVDEIDPVTQQITTKELSQVTGQVATTSLITLVFDDIMNVGTILTPSSGTAPFITVMLDDDGNLSDPSDQTVVGGTWSYVVDKEALTTTAVFTPTGGLPSGGSGQRKVVVNIPPQVVDLVANPVANGGLKSFTPQVQIFGPITIPPGGEQFADQTALDGARSSADWGETSPGLLLPGAGGGSGRLGDLVVPAGQTVTLNTSPAHATAAIQFVGIPNNNGSLTLGDPLTPTVFTFKTTLPPPTDPSFPYSILRRNTFVSHQIAEAAMVLNNFVAPDPVGFPQDLVIEQATYTVDGDLLVITWDTPGTVGNGAFFISPTATPAVVIPANFTAGGVDSVSFGGPGEPGEGELVTNFDFQANPAGVPPPFTISDGLFEFARLTIEAQGTLVFAGTNPARLYVRGLFELRSQGLVSAAGESQPVHLSNAPLGQLGGDAGPSAGAGGGGADRPDNTGSDLISLTPVQNAGLQNPSFGQSFGRQGLGVGGQPGSGAGLGGARFPNFQPTQTWMPFEMEANEVGGKCVSQQVAGPGSGGAYSKDGGDGLPVALNPTALPVTLGGTGASNTPGNTAGGDFNQVGLPLPGVVPIGARSLDPDSGFLRGGSGGGGGGASIEDSETKKDPAGNTPPIIRSDCFVDPPVVAPPTPTPVIVYRSHSGGAGGGGGGAVQVQAGREADLSGTIDASGGDGGSADATAAPQAARATPGGGGSGGGILIQARFVDVAPVPNRLLINGGSGGSSQGGFSTGGDGSPGLVRAESIIQNPAFFDEVAAAIDPFDPTVFNQQDPNNPNAAINWLTTDTWLPETTLPGSFSAGQSCWYKPVGNFVLLDFHDDTLGFGWDLDLILDTGGGPQVVAYRSSSFFGGNSPQEHWGELYAEGGGPGAPIVVRFQGAKSQGTIVDPCNIDPFAIGSPIDPDSITQWVRHPDELDAFQPAPDMVRFLVLFDASHPDFPFIQGVTNLRIGATPN